MQCFICLLHFNELPLRHLILKLYGSATGPNDCENKNLINFQAIQTEFPDIDSKGLSTDQKYLWNIANAVSTGNCSIKLSLMKPGKINLSRWLTTASRFLRLCVSEKTLQSC